ncbi:MULTISPECIES: hypothetical protein [unclassified Imperialibacter]|jgi:ribosome-associated translation inhibitor RaiA|uniref:hypothetical protein n=1 Tax=unclassified Imperialibacter TaxID=2629706 RepID=UPI001256B589|nr:MULTISPECIES: hypothetical protein [unclassified Imperialibacter]CAD5259440.1 conserved hypothetical protein [Imperialibacter sp. 75]CAD5297647.1 conserved hypothetical protein [Imperialibacter sp. 89]VVT02392.1 conserved hypothetical protein [Imperialibacter sp. EC-SDR9]
MDIAAKAKEEIESRLKKIESFIEEKGLGSSYLTKARRTQRNVNLAIAVGTLITVAGISIWLLSSSRKD